MIFISEQYPQYAGLQAFNKPSAMITNSIDLDMIPLYPAPANTPPRLLFIGSPGMACTVEEVSRSCQILS